MVPDEYLYRGLCALARAHRAGTMAGHLGAAVVAGYFLAREWLGHDAAVAEAIRHELDRIRAGEERLWFDPARTGITVEELFEPFENAEIVRNGIARLTKALWASVDRLRQSGHNVIFASLALKAIALRPQFAQEPVVAGLERLLGLFASAGPGRGYYGRERGWQWPPRAPLADDRLVPVYRSPRAAARVVLSVLANHAGERRRGYGGLFHLITHARALLDLEELGARELARAALAAHRQHVRAWLGLPRVDQELGTLKRAIELPDSPEYWRRHRQSVQWSGWLTHRLKVLYAFHALLPLAPTEQARNRALQALGYLLA